MYHPKGISLRLKGPQDFGIMPEMAKNVISIRLACLNDFLCCPSKETARGFKK